MSDATHKEHPGIDPDDPRLTAYALGELDDAERELFEAQITDRAALDRLVGEIRAAGDLMSAALAGEPSPGLESSQRRSLESQLNLTPEWDGLGNDPPVEVHIQPVTLFEKVSGAMNSKLFRGGVAACVLLVVVMVTISFTTQGLQTVFTKVGTQLQASPQVAYNESAAKSTPGYYQDEYAASRSKRDESRFQNFSREAGAGGYARPSPAATSPTAGYPGLPAPEPAVSERPSRAPVALETLPLPKQPPRIDPQTRAGQGQGKGEGQGGGSGRPFVGPGQAVVNPLPTVEVEEIAGDNPLGTGRGPGRSGDDFARINENEFKLVTDDPQSTFSVDVDKASYTYSRRALLQNNILPPPDAVRIEEFINYFQYEYAQPTDDIPFSANIEVAACPWDGDHRLIRVGLQGREITEDKRPNSNLVFLLDVSGSMNQPDKLGYVKDSMKQLVKMLNEKDRVAIVVYAGASGLVLDSTACTSSGKQTILDALDNLQAGGSTNGGAGIELAYSTALRYKQKHIANRVILCTDGDFNVGVTSRGDLERLIVEKAKSGVFLSVFGFGTGNLKDSTMENLSNKGNGTYGYIDTMEEAEKSFVRDLAGTLVTIAKDVKIQIEFNPNEVGAYRLIGYENRMLAHQDFNDDKKDAGEIGAGHRVTALYEIVPPSKVNDVRKVDGLKYQQKVAPTKAADSGELLTLKLRYKEPEGSTSKLLEFPVRDRGQSFGQASAGFKWAASVASFGMKLRQSKFAGDATYASILETVEPLVSGDDERAEFVQMVKSARRITGQR